MRIEMVNDIYTKMKEISDTLDELSSQVNDLAICFKVDRDVEEMMNENSIEKQKVLNELNMILENGLNPDDVYGKSKLRDIMNSIILRYPE